MSEAAQARAQQEPQEDAAAARLLRWLRLFASDPRRIFLIIYVAMPVIVTVQNSVRTPRAMNNFLIFARSFFSLIQGENLYAPHEESHFDVFKYSPTFALAMGPFAVVPKWLGLLAWNLLNTTTLFAAIQLLPVEQRKKNFIHWFAFIELITATENAQSNALLAGLILLTFIALERGWLKRAALWIAVAGFIKIYGFGALALGALYRRRLWLGVALFAASAVLLVLPLVATSPEKLIEQYASWRELLRGDHDALSKLSVMGVLEKWFSLHPNKTAVALVGCALYGLALLRRGAFGDVEFRIRVLCSTLVFIIIFNHMAESATYIIAVVGVTLWYTLEPRGRIDRALIVLTYVFTVFSPFDLFPAVIRREIVIPWLLKAVPCIVIWGRMQYELYTWQRAEAVPAVVA